MRLLTPGEAALAAKVSEATIFRWIKKGILVESRFGAGTVRVVADDDGIPVKGPKAEDGGKEFRRQIRRLETKTRKAKARARG